MKALISRYIFVKILVICFAVGGLSVFAANNAAVRRALSFGRPAVAVAISGTVKRDGSSLSLDKAEQVRAGETLDWSIVSTNNGDGNADGYRVVGQIPTGTEFVAGSAGGDETPAVAYSIDGGKTYAAKPMIEERQPDGTVRLVPAPISRYTQIRFEWSKSLAPQNTLNARYQVRVR